MRGCLFLFIFAVSLPVTAWADADHIRPNPVLTPGRSVAGVTVDELCDRGYAGRVRDVSAATKRQVFAAYGLAGNRQGFCAGPHGCEVDHLISLELGGDNDVRNLWPEPYDGPWNAADKDRLENRLHRLVCAKRIPLDAAQAAIATDWIAAYRLYVGDGRNETDR